MRIRKRLIARLRRSVFAGCMLLASCAPPPQHDAEFYVFGTLVEVSLHGTDTATAAQAFGELQFRFQRMHRDWHAWEPGLLTHINASFSLGQPALANAQLIELTRRSQRYEQLTDGRFNAAIGQLIETWGFHTSDFPILGPPPSRTEIAELLGRHPSAADIEFEGALMRSRNPAVQLDFGGIAKGYAVDLACQELKRLGVESALVSAGGDVRACGLKGARPWRVAVRDPASPAPGDVLGVIEVSGGESVSTSGDYVRYREAPDGKRYPHILDPRTGYPASGAVSATVIAAEGTLADAAATALVIAGIQEWRAVAEPLGITHVLLVTDDGRIYATAAMRKRLEMRNDAPLVNLEDA